MIFFLFLFNILRTNEIEEILFEECNIKKAEEMALSLGKPDDQIYLYFIYRVFYGKQEEAFFRLIAGETSSKDFYKIIFSHNSFFSFGLNSDFKETADLAIKVAEKVKEVFEKRRSDIKSKRHFKKIKKEKYLYETIEHLTYLIGSGDSKAETNFLKLIKGGHIEPEKYLKVLKILSERGNQKAMGILGMLYYEGKGVEKCFTTAMHYFMEGANKQDPVCYNGLGLIFLHESHNDLLAAKAYFEEASKRGLAEADYNLYKFFKDVYMVEEMGLVYLLNAANKGFLPAIYSYALKLYQSKNYRVSLQYLCSVCDYSTDLVEIQNKAEKRFVERKYKSSLMYLLFAGEMGSIHSMQNALFLLYNHSGLIENQNKIIFDLNHRLAQMGHKNNLVKLGDCYFYGIGVEKSYTSSFSIYLSASLLDDPEGFYSVAYMYENGLGCEKDVRKALNYISRIMKYEPKAYLLVWYVEFRLISKICVQFFWRKRVFISSLFACLIGLFALKFNPRIISKT
ncbi:hypothetical protein CWI36_0096p0050 [Hamiltosporidium magnivora]|uniref:Sel1 repeat-containing protein n=1 Tax=Hamiltosporidium magnivora TaxID=148818 RepID=A0A4Q9LFR1_9MICR|nr:hypothetical protein CWI36_0591p0030 [Hamiltosporidium magnivora]TBU08809.1 hypothetical protein CWI36_0096p0050 [Hamiltosporidium magnivora]